MIWFMLGVTAAMLYSRLYKIAIAGAISAALIHAVGLFAVVPSIIILLCAYQLEEK